MAQFGRPDSDVTREDWVDEGSATTSLYASIDETTASDADYVKSATGPTSDVYVCGLSNVEDPVVHTGHKMKYRYKKNSAGGAQIDLTVQLRQGYTTETAMGTLIAGTTLTNIGATWTTGTVTLSTAEAGTISDYTDLQLRLVANQV